MLDYNVIGLVPYSTMSRLVDRTHPHTQLPVTHYSYLALYYNSQPPSFSD